MEKYEEAFLNAKKNLQVADHMVYVTYNIVNDPKLMMVIIENVFLALTNSMSSVLYYDLLYKRVSPFQDTFDPKLEIFARKYKGKDGVDERHIQLMRDVKKIIIEHRKSPVEFRRDGRFVICSDKYEMKTVTIEKLKSYLSLTKEFVGICERIIKNGNWRDDV